MTAPPAIFLPSYTLTPSPNERKGRPSLERRTATETPGGEVLNTVHESTPNVVVRQRAGTQSYRKLVFSDPIAFRYLEESEGTIVIDRRRRLEGYEIYVVEQWACSRTHPTFIICTYTGDPSHSCLVNVLGVPRDESAWSPRLKLYTQAVSQFHARERETPLGTLMVTNLSGFPSALTVISVPDGDIRKHREDLIVNENLKRMGCSGRAAINLQPPQSTTITKFHQVYHTSESVGIYPSVIELVKLCQTALIIYGKLEAAYADGLLCDITEKAINEWWTEIGTYFFNIEPSDGALGPTTVAAVLGLLIGAYNRLKAFGAPVGKDVLDIPSMKRAIGYLQKSTKMERTRRLDRETLDRLHRATAKSAAGEGWTVPKAVKSTVAELSGKGGEMVMGIVGSRDKAGISEAETLNIDRLSQLVTGPKMKWLWQGKQMKSGSSFSPLQDDGMQGKIFSTDDQGGFIWTSGDRQSFQGSRLERSETLSTQHTTEGKSGFGRIRDAVGLKQHGQRLHKDGEHSDIDERPVTPFTQTDMREQHGRETLGNQEQGAQQLPFDLALKDASPETKKNAAAQAKAVQQSTQAPWPPHRNQLRSPVPAESPRKQKINADMASLREEFKSEHYQNFSTTFRYSGPISRALKRSQSALQIIDQGPDNPRQNRLNRQLSFSLVESTILAFRDALEGDEDKKPTNERPASALAAQDTGIIAAQRRSRQILRLQQGLIPFTEQKVSQVEKLDQYAAQHLEELNDLYYQKLEEYEHLRHTSSAVVSQEKGILQESLRRVEMLGAKLDYELNALQSRMQEVDDGVAEFERNVLAIEARVRELAGQEERVTMPWLQRAIHFLSARK